MTRTATDSPAPAFEATGQLNGAQHAASTNLALEAWSAIANHEKKVWGDVFSGKGTTLECLEVGGQTLAALTLGGTILGGLGASAGLLAIEDVGVQTATLGQGLAIGALFGGAAGTLGALSEELFLDKGNKK